VATFDKVMDPWCNQWTAAVLSLSRALVDSVMGVAAANTTWWAIAPNSSRLELVIVPVGLLVETNCWQILAKKGSRQSMAGWWLLGGNQTPPMPSPEASQLPRYIGSCGVILHILVGCWASVNASHQKLSRKLWVASWCRHMWCQVSVFLNASWSMLKSL